MNDRSSLAPYRDLSLATLYLMVGLIPIQMVLFALFPHPGTILGWFTLFRDSPLVGFIGFDVLYMLSNILMVLFYLSLMILIKEKMNRLTLFALLLSLVSMTIYFSSNRAIEMFTISGKYFAASSQSQRDSFIAAGELLLSVYKGTSYFVYYVLNGLSLLLLFRSLGGVDGFSRRTLVAGQTSGFLMLVPASMGTVGMVFSLLSLIPWIVTCLFLAKDIRSMKIEE